MSDGKTFKFSGERTHYTVILKTATQKQEDQITELFLGYDSTLLDNPTFMFKLDKDISKLLKGTETTYFITINGKLEQGQLTTRLEITVN